MTTLEAVKPGCSVHSVLPCGGVTVVSVRWLGAGAIELTPKGPRDNGGKNIAKRSNVPEAFGQCVLKIREKRQASGGAAA